MTIINFCVNVLQDILINNSRMNIFYGKVIEVKNWYYLPEIFAIKQVIWLKLVTPVYLTRFL